MSERVDVEVGGYRVQLLIDGDSGPVVVLCSGLGGRALHWSDTVADLADDHVVVRFDRPGTPVPTSRQTPPSVQGEANRISAVLDALQRPGSAVVVGHSVGGFFAEGFARLYPKRTSALLLLDSSIAPDHPGRFALPLTAKLAAADAAAELLTKLHLQTPLIRAGLTLLQRRRAGGLDARTRSEIRSAAADPGFTAALLDEYVYYYAFAAELCILRGACPLPPVPRTVATGHTGWRTRHWRSQQIRLAEVLDAEHVTVAPAGHHVMIDQPRRTAELIRAMACRHADGAPVDDVRN